MTTIPSSEYLQMAGRAGRRGKDDRGASIICIDEEFGRIPHTDEYEEMFDNQGQALESKLKMSYKTNLNILNQEGAEIDSLIKSSFFSNASEQQKMNAFKQKQLLVPQINRLRVVECAECATDAMGALFAMYKRLCHLNQEVSVESNLKPFNMHIVNVFNPSHKFHDVVVLQPMAHVKLGAKKTTSQFLCVYLEKEAQHRRTSQFEEEAKVPERGNLKKEGVDQETKYFYEYLTIEAKDVVCYYKNIIT